MKKCETFESRLFVDKMQKTERKKKDQIQPYNYMYMMLRNRELFKINEPINRRSLLPTISLSKRLNHGK